MSYRLSTMIWRDAARSVSAVLSGLGERIVRHRDLVAVVGFVALVLAIKFTVMLTDHDAPHTATPAAPPAVAHAAAPPVAAQPTAHPQAQPVHPQAQPATPQQRPAERTYQVRPGDTLAQIALRHGVDYQRIAADNRLVDPNRIHPGQTLRLGQPTPGTRLIAPGDTLTGLATTTGVTVRELRALNPWITRPSHIPAGAGLRIRP